jgi:hypothetical protein
MTANHPDYASVSFPAFFQGYFYQRLYLVLMIMMMIFFIDLFDSVGC